MPFFLNFVSLILNILNIYLDNVHSYAVRLGFKYKMIFIEIYIYYLLLNKRKKLQSAFGDTEIVY